MPIVGSGPTVAARLATGATRADADDPARSSRRPDLVAAGVGAVLAGLVFLLVRGALIDDAYITLSYARNLAEHAHWGLTEFRTANTATSPLNVLLLGAAAFVVRDAVWGLGLVFVLLNAAQAWGLSRLARALGLPAAAGAAAFALVLLSPLMLSVVGMEMTLAVTLVVWLTLAAVERRPVLFALMAAALVLTRVDLGIFPLVLLLASRPMRRRALPIIGVAALAVAPWYAFSWWVLGALVPDTLVLKTITGSSWGPWEFLNGPVLYWHAYPTATLLTGLTAGIGCLAVLLWFPTRAWRRPAWSGLGPLAALGVAGIGHFVAYALLSPPPYHWYYAPSVASLAIVGALGLGGGLARGQAAVGARLTAAAVAVALLLTDAGFALTRSWDATPITTNWATAADYRAIGERLRTEAAGQVVQSPGEIGALAYWCECDIVDPFSDRGTLAPMVREAEEQAGPLMRAFLRLNSTRLDEGIPAATPTRELVYRPGAPMADWTPVTSPWRGPGAIELSTP